MTAKILKHTHHTANNNAATKTAARSLLLLSERRFPKPPFSNAEHVISPDTPGSKRHH